MSETAKIAPVEGVGLQRGVWGTLVPGRQLPNCPESVCLIRSIS